MPHHHPTAGQTGAAPSSTASSSTAPVTVDRGARPVATTGLLHRPVAVPCGTRPLPAAGDWGELVARLDPSSGLERWRLLEPALSDRDLAGLPDELRPGVDPQLADELLGALVRLAAASGHDEPDAVLVLLHLLGDGARALAARLGDLAEDVLALVVGELAVQIRAFPVQRRQRAYAANLLLDTKAALLRELRPHRTRAHPDAREVLVDPTDPAGCAAAFETREAPGADDGDLDLIDVLVWAARTGVVAVQDLALLLQSERDRGQPGGDQPTVARHWGLSERTLRRRRERALLALQGASDRYLRDCA